MLSSLDKRGTLLAAKDLHIDFDQWLNPFIPANPTRHLPWPISRILGYRAESTSKVGNIITAFWAAVGAYIGLLIVAISYKFSSTLQQYDPPVLFASFGATAVLTYNAISSPLAQPRASILGNVLSATIGVGVAKLFALSSDSTSLQWISAPLACALASFAMTLTNTIHPPGGAAAVLATIDTNALAMGWMFVPFVIVGTSIMLGVGLLTNNIQRQFPIFWWTPDETGAWWRRRRERRNCSTYDTEAAADSLSSSGMSESEKHDEMTVRFEGVISVTGKEVRIPYGIELNEMERTLLRDLQQRLSAWNGELVGRKRSESSFQSDRTHVEPEFVA